MHMACFDTLATECWQLCIHSYTVDQNVRNECALLSINFLFLWKVKFVSIFLSFGANASKNLKKIHTIDEEKKL